MVATLAICAGTLALSSAPATAAPDNEGADFWLVFPGNMFADPAVELRLFITGRAATTGAVEIPGLAFSAPFTVTPGTVTSVSLPAGAHLMSSDTVENRGIHVTAAAEVSVFGLNRVGASTDAYLGLPTDVLGTEYIVLSYRVAVFFDEGSQFTIVGTQPTTTVTIVPSATVGARAAGVPYVVVLNAGETYQLKAGGNADLSGTVITSDKPVSVFGSHRCANVPPATPSCNHLVEQLPPTSAWGQEFGSVPLASRTGGDIFRFVASADATTVSVNGAVVAALNRGQVHERLITGNARISADKPILVAQYSRGEQADGTQSDPFQMLIPPLGHFQASYTITAPATRYTRNFVNLVVPNAAVGAVNVDGVAVPAAQYSPIPGTTYSGAQVAITVGSHEITGPAPFGAWVYGFATSDGYGYPGGFLAVPGATPTSVALAPKTETPSTNTSACVTATVRDGNGAPVLGVRVDFAVTGTNPNTGSTTTNSAGAAEHCYTGANPGTDDITATVGALSDTATKAWAVPATTTAPPTTLPPATDPPTTTTPATGLPPATDPPTTQAPAMTAPPVSDAPPMFTVSPTLPATGDVSNTTAAVAFWLVGTGGAALLIARRRAPR